MFPVVPFLGDLYNVPHKILCDFSLIVCKASIFKQTLEKRTAPAFQLLCIKHSLIHNNRKIEYEVTHFAPKKSSLPKDLIYAGKVLAEHQLLELL